MISLEHIKQLSDEAAVQAAEENKQPFVFWDDADIQSNLRNIPNIGSHEPEGWEEYGKPLFADKSGFGNPDEPSLTFAHLTGAIRAIIDRSAKSVGFAIVEEGQFQLYIQPFRRV